MHLAFGPPALLRTPGQEGVDPLETALRYAAAFAAKTARWNQPGAPLVYSTTRPAPELVARVEALGLPGPEARGTLYVDGPREDIENVRVALIEGVRCHGFTLIHIEATGSSPEEVEKLTRILGYLTAARCGRS
jgi:hypothetical protein